MKNAWTEEIDRLRAENIKLKAADIRLHKEANINMQEICRLRGQLAKVRSLIVKSIKRPASMIVKRAGAKA